MCCFSITEHLISLPSEGLLAAPVFATMFLCRPRNEWLYSRVDLVLYSWGGRRVIYGLIVGRCAPAGRLGHRRRWSGDTPHAVPQRPRGVVPGVTSVRCCPELSDAVRRCPQLSDAVRCCPVLSDVVLWRLICSDRCAAQNAGRKSK